MPLDVVCRKDVYLLRANPFYVWIPPRTSAHLATSAIHKVMSTQMPAVTNKPVIPHLLAICYTRHFYKPLSDSFSRAARLASEGRPTLRASDATYRGPSHNAPPNQHLTTHVLLCASIAFVGPWCIIEVMKTTKRNQDIKRLYETGLHTMREIAGLYNVSGERIRQIIRAQGATHTRPYYIAENLGHMDTDTAASATGIKASTLRKYGLLTPRRVITEGECGIGQRGEELVANILKERGHIIRLMPNHHPFDILVNGKTRIDVKSRNTPSKNPHGKKTLWLFNIGRKPHVERCDFFICLIRKYNDVLVIPSDTVAGIRIVGITHTLDRISPKINRWDKYLNAWELIT